MPGPLILDQRWTTDLLAQLNVTQLNVSQINPILAGTLGGLGGAQVSATGLAAITNTETLILATPIVAAQTLKVNSRVVWVLDLTSTSTAANVTTFTVRMGTAGTVAGDTSFGTLATSAAGTTGTNVPGFVIITLVFKAVGAAATANGGAQIVNNAATALSGAVTNVISNTGFTGTNANTATFIDLSVASAAATTSVTVNDVSCFIFA